MQVFFNKYMAKEKQLPRAAVNNKQYNLRVERSILEILTRNLTYTGR